MKGKSRSCTKTIHLQQQYHQPERGNHHLHVEDSNTKFTIILPMRLANESRSEGAKSEYFTIMLTRHPASHFLQLNKTAMSALQRESKE